MVLRRLIDNDKRILKKYEKVAKKVEALSDQMESLSDVELKDKTKEFQSRYQTGETLDDLLVEAFAAIREGAKRVLGLYPYRVQIQGGIALHDGNIAEMKTGEGKTLTATMPVYLNALSGEGVHVVTVNDYLAARDSDEMGELYRWMGLTVGLNKTNLTASEKREAYKSDVTYSTNNELGFDYLRDNMQQSKESMVQRPLNYAVLDEVDSILIDEARTPLIISGQASNTSSYYTRCDFFVKGLKADTDYIVDIESKTVALTEDGIDLAEKTFRTPNLYNVNNQALLHHIDKALQANFIMIANKDYVVSEEEVKIVDQFTGRIMEGRRYSDGLHQAIEAKEAVTIQKETKTMANITYQNYFRMYQKLSGMTGTAKTEEEEFREIYNMHVIGIPTNRPILRDDKEDLLFPTLNGKYLAIVEEIEKCVETGQPVLVGTASVEVSEHIGSLLSKKGIVHEVLNAKNHFREAEIIVNAGAIGAVTIATNMAGRGTDIKISAEVKALGGLYVIGTERHESRRIDNQLRGRSGRQGDPGVSQFYLSLEDELLQRFGAEKLKNIMSLLSDDETTPIRSKMFTKQIESAQKRVEGNNYDSRKNVLKYDDVMREQREIIYKDRLEVINTEDTSYIVRPIINRVVARVVDTYTQQTNIEDYDLKTLVNVASTTLNLNDALKVEMVMGMESDEIKELIMSLTEVLYEGKLENLTSEKDRTSFERTVLLSVVDKVWTEHIDQMDGLRQGISLQSYAQGDPMIAYQEQGVRMFESMISELEYDVVQLLLHSRIRHNQAE